MITNGKICVILRPLPQISCVEQDCPFFASLLATLWPFRDLSVSYNIFLTFSFEIFLQSTQWPFFHHYPFHLSIALMVLSFNNTASFSLPILATFLSFPNVKIKFDCQNLCTTKIMNPFIMFIDLPRMNLNPPLPQIRVGISFALFLDVKISSPQITLP